MTTFVDPYLQAKVKMQGRNAADSGFPATDNPYPEDHPMRAVWGEGFSEAQEAIAASPPPPEESL